MVGKGCAELKWLIDAIERKALPSDRLRILCERIRTELPSLIIQRPLGEIYAFADALKNAVRTSKLNQDSQVVIATEIFISILKPPFGHMHRAHQVFIEAVAKIILFGIKTSQEVKKRLESIFTELAEVVKTKVPLPNIPAEAEDRSPSPSVSVAQTQDRLKEDKDNEAQKLIDFATSLGQLCLAQDFPELLCLAREKKIMEAHAQSPFTKSLMARSAKTEAAVTPDWTTGILKGNTKLLRLAVQKGSGTSTEPLRLRRPSFGSSSAQNHLRSPSSLQIYLPPRQLLGKSADAFFNESTQRKGERFLRESERKQHLLTEKIPPCSFALALRLIRAAENLFPHEIQVLSGLLFQKLASAWKENEKETIVEFLFNDDGIGFHTNCRRLLKAISHGYHLEIYLPLAVFVINHLPLFESLSKALIGARNVLFEEKRVRAAHLSFMECLISLISDECLHFNYVLHFYALHERFLAFAKHILATDEWSIDEIEFLQRFFLFFHEILKKKIIDIHVLSRLATVLDRECADEILFAAWLEKISHRSLVNTPLVLLAAAFVQKVVPYSNFPGIRSAFLRISYICLLQSYNIPAQNAITVAFLKIIRAILSVKTVSEVSSTIRYLRMLTFFSQELDLETEDGRKSPISDTSLRLDLSKLHPQQLIERPSMKERRNFREVYACAKIHRLFVEILCALLLNASNNSFDEEVTGQYPHQNGRPHYLFTLQCHLAHPANRPFLFGLYSSLDLRAARREFQIRLTARAPLPVEFTCRQFLEQSMVLWKTASDLPTPHSVFSREGSSSAFQLSIFAQEAHFARACRRIVTLSDTSRYHKYYIGGRIGAGSFSTVHEASFKLNSAFAIKLIEGDKTPQDRNALFLLFSEVSILENLQTAELKERQSGTFLKLLDFGATTDFGYFLLFLRLESAPNTQGNLSATLQLFYQIVVQVEALHGHGVTHYDIKKDNIMVGRSGPLVIDFGESLQCEQNFRLRGTELIRAPELLLSGFEAFTADHPNFQRSYKDLIGLYNRQNRCVVGPSCDVWGLGCLLFEIFTGRFLFAEKDWSAFFERVTGDTLPLVSQENLMLMGNAAFLSNIIQFALNRNPQHRPSARVLRKRLAAVCRALEIDIAPVAYPVITPLVQEEVKAGETLLVLASAHCPNKFVFSVCDCLIVGWGSPTPNTHRYLPILLNEEIAFDDRPGITEELVGMLWRTLRATRAGFALAKQVYVHANKPDCVLALGFLFYCFMIGTCDKTDLIQFERKSFGAAEISDSAFSLLQSIFDVVQEVQHRLQTLGFLFCDCRRVFIALNSEEKTQLRMCRCSQREASGVDWECPLGFCLEYATIRADRLGTKTAAREVAWTTLPVESLWGLELARNNGREAFDRALIEANCHEAIAQNRLASGSEIISCAGCECILGIINVHTQTFHFPCESIHAYSPQKLAAIF